MFEAHFSSVANILRIRKKQKQFKVTPIIIFQRCNLLNIITIRNKFFMYFFKNCDLAQIQAFVLCYF